MKQSGHLLSNANVEGAVGEAVLEAVEAGAAPHRRVDAHHPLVLLRLRYQRIRKDGCVGRRLVQTRIPVQHKNVQPKTIRSPHCQ